ncbi:hypothetical protein [Paraburkholderia unamae]|uniref:Uncharacterized protein n=1 Tax=Paraburkholderia unamae TaxID=219649 RepID=A0ACC6RGU5_9BURK
MYYESFSQYVSNDVVSADLEPADVGEDLAVYRRIWAAVLIQAIRDYEAIYQQEQGKHDPRCKKFDAEELKRWFASDEISAGSFAWICSILSLDTKLVRAKVYENPMVLFERHK